MGYFDDGEPVFVPRAETVDVLRRLRETIPKEELDLIVREYARLLQAGERLEQVNALLREKVLTDPLTGVWNRSYLDAQLQSLHEHARHPGYRRDSWLVYADGDRFKQVNDQYGHEMGDIAIIALAQYLKSRTRATDPVIRLGGDEFVICFAQLRDIDGKLGSIVRELPAYLAKIAPAQHAKTPAERLRFENTGITTLGDLGLTLSIGAAVIDPALEIGEIKRHADCALYSAKARRNTWSVYA